MTSKYNKIIGARIVTYQRKSTRTAEVIEKSTYMRRRKDQSDKGFLKQVERYKRAHTTKGVLGKDEPDVFLEAMA